MTLRWAPKRQKGYQVVVDKSGYQVVFVTQRGPPHPFHVTTWYPFTTWYPANGTPPPLECDHLVPLYHFGTTPDHPPTPGYKLAYVPPLGTLTPPPVKITISKKCRITSTKYPLPSPPSGNADLVKKGRAHI